MTINTETAQLILDAIAWCNKDWQDALEWDMNPGGEIEQARADFIRFCRARGIDTIEKVVTLKCEP